TEEQKAAVVRDLLTTAPPGSSAPAAILERPKVLHNAAKGTWLMWVHADGPSETSDAQYAKARAGVAVSDSPTGPFRWMDSYRLHHAPEGEPHWAPDHPRVARASTSSVPTSVRTGRHRRCSSGRAPTTSSPRARPAGTRTRRSMRRRPRSSASGPTTATRSAATARGPPTARRAPA